MQPSSIEERRMQSGKGVSRFGAHAAIVVFYVVGGLLNGGNLLRAAEGMEYGSRSRELCIALARPVAAMARATRLDRPRPWIEVLSNRLMQGRTGSPSATP